ncbi:MAG: hypothetical protein DM484_04925, partial [Candidatus Methylumidiphilus alinenensis]
TGGSFFVAACPTVGATGTTLAPTAGATEGGFPAIGAADAGSTTDLDAVGGFADALETAALVSVVGFTPLDSLTAMAFGSLACFVGKVLLVLVIWIFSANKLD